MRYRKKPVEIEAFVWTGEPDQTGAPVWVAEAVEKGTMTFSQINGNLVAHIETLEGVMTAQPGDYIVKGIKGELYPVKPDIFEASNELVKDVRNPSETSPSVVYIDYVNYRDVRTEGRKILPMELVFGISEYYEEPQWSLHAFDFGKGAIRTFAVNKIEHWRTSEKREG